MDIQELHNQAMELADQADYLKMQGKDKEAKLLFSQSLDAERDAAYAAREQNLGEPTESVLFRSAASLAYDLVQQAENCGDSEKEYREAERLICMGLAGNPPAEIAEELRGLYDTVNFERSMEEMEFSSTENEHENVTITIPIQERSLLKVLVRKFGWACIF